MKKFCPVSFLFLASLVAYSEELITVTVSGYGATPEAAERSALQKAVRKAVGEMVDAETIAQNGELIKDKVLTYSDGFVQSKKTISGPEKVRSAEINDLERQKKLLITFSQGKQEDLTDWIKSQRENIIYLYGEHDEKYKEVGLRIKKIN